MEEYYRGIIMKQDKKLIDSVKKKLKVKGRMQEYSILDLQCLNLEDSYDAITDTYKKASLLFDPDFRFSIAADAMEDYKKTINTVLDDFTKGMDELVAANVLLFAYINIQALLYENESSLNKRLLSELNDNYEYYKLFGIDYYFELSRTDGLSTSLSELEADVNTRITTYTGAAYKEYLQMLPDIYSIFESALKKNVKSFWLS